MSTPEKANKNRKYNIRGIRALGGMKTCRGDIEQIEALISGIAPEKPIMEICFHDSNHAEVDAGFLAGPLCGEGVIYFVIKDGKAWSMDNTKEPLEWIS